MGSKVISFRFDDDKLALLQQHQVEGESENQTAMRLLLGVLGVEGKKPSLQSVDIVDNIRNEIKESLVNGDIKDAIANSYEATMGQFNGLLEELQALQKQLEELKSIPPAAVPNSPITDEQFTEESDRPLHPSPNADLLDKPTIILHDGSILVISSEQETVLTLLGLIPQTHNLLTSKSLGEFCKGNLADNKGELESLIKQEIDSKGSTIRKTAAILRNADFVLSGSEAKGFVITGIK